MDIKTGMIVLSAAGHDKGNFMVCVAADEEFVYIADGRERKLCAPKKKRLKHIKPTNTVIDTNDLTDKMLRSVLRDYCNKQPQGK